MEYGWIIGISLFFFVLLFFILQLDLKKLKQLGNNKKLNALAEQFPDNKTICESILTKLGNTSVKVKEDIQAKTSLYVVVGNSITIANIRDSFMRVQTVAHECSHSVQNKRVLWFNFIFTNLYILYFVGIIVATVFKFIHNPLVYLCILLLMGLVQYSIRSMLETEAMTKARYIAKEYLEENQLCQKEELDELISQYDKMNEIGIHLVNYDILTKTFIKVIVYAVIALFIL